MAGNIIWYQDDKEVSNISLGGVRLMYEATQWDDYKFHSFTAPSAPETVGADFNHAHLKWEWTGSSAIHDCRYVLVSSGQYSGDDNPDSDVNELQDWANDGTIGINRYPTGCQRYNVCTIVIDDNHTDGYYVTSINSTTGGVATCGNLSEGAHNKCLPCLGHTSGNLVNANPDWVWNTGHEWIQVMSGGLIISQKSDGSDWVQVNSSVAFGEDYPPFSVPITAGTIQPESLTDVFLKVCIPWGCFCGGRRSIGLGIDYIVTY